MRLENKKELKEYTWKAIMSSPTWGSGKHALSPMRELLGSLGFHVRPRKTASVKSEFTFTMPSSAVRWMLVVIFRGSEGGAWGMEENC